MRYRKTKTDRIRSEDTILRGRGREREREKKIE
jgi:hypothetical protein